MFAATRVVLVWCHALFAATGVVLPGRHALFAATGVVLPWHWTVGIARFIACIFARHRTVHVAARILRMRHVAVHCAIVHPIVHRTIMPGSVCHAVVPAEFAGSRSGSNGWPAMIH